MIKFWGVAKGLDQVHTRRDMLEYLSRRTPELMRVVEKTQREMADEITYEEIRQALLSGDIPSAWLARWRELYSALVLEELAPAWRAAMAEASAPLIQRYDGYVMDLQTPAILTWAQQRASALVTRVCEQQREAIRALVGRALTPGSPTTVDLLAQQIRPVIGLTVKQAEAVYGHFERMRDRLVARHPRTDRAVLEQRAQRMAARYAAVKHRERAMTVARTELAAAYNIGEYQAVSQAMEAGYMGGVVKVWLDADDGRVCKRCRALGKASREHPVPMEAAFEEPGGQLSKPGYSAGLCPPLHPRCRCVVAYEEISQGARFVAA